MPLRFLILNILSFAGVEISAGSSVRGLGVRFHTSDIRRETSLNDSLYRVDIQLVCDGHKNPGGTTRKDAKRSVSGAFSFGPATVKNF